MSQKANSCLYRRGNDELISSVQLQTPCTLQQICIWPFSQVASKLHGIAHLPKQWRHQSQFNWRRVLSWEPCLHFSCHKTSELLVCGVCKDDYATISLADCLAGKLALLLWRGSICLWFCSSFCDAWMTWQPRGIFAQVFIVLHALCGPGADASGSLVVFIVNIYTIYIMYTYMFVLNLYMGRALRAFFLCRYTCVVQHKPTH